MTRVFADTNFYIALLRPEDVLHERSLRFDRSYRGDFVTSEFVMLELANWLSSSRNREVYTALRAALADDPRTTVIRASSQWISRGEAL